MSSKDSMDLRDSEIIFHDDSQDIESGKDLTMLAEGVGTVDPDSSKSFPPPILDVDPKYIDEFKIWLRQWLLDLQSSQAEKLKDMADQEDLYRALPGPRVTRPYVGACNDTIPAAAMAVDPIHARLDTGIFKNDPVFTFKALKKSATDYVVGLGQWFDYYQKNKLRLRQIASPRLLECTKLGTCVFKTVYDRESYKIKTYDSDNGFAVVEKQEVRFAGPRVFGISLGDFLFPPDYEQLSDCPIVIERQRTTLQKLMKAQAAGKVANIDKIRFQVQANQRNELEVAREQATDHAPARRYPDELEVFEAWCDYDIDGDGDVEHLVATYHMHTNELIQLRYNWYFHQSFPYTVIPYSIANGSLYGIGICEMVKPFQEALTKWHRMATDNAYIANIRMFIVKKESGIEEVPNLYAGRCFFVDNPTQDFIPFSGGDIYPSTLSERQNIFGLVEKRTGVSDYLTGRESPIIGTRATATSTLALIQEGTRRVEEVLENIRVGMADIAEKCLYIWFQYGLEGLDDLVFGDDDIATQLKEFFSQYGAENVNGAIAIDLTATDASGNRQAMQQMQLQIINVMMQYLEKLLASGQAALQYQTQMPQFTAMIVDVMNASRKMFKDLLQKYDIRNPEAYLPDLEQYLGNGQNPAAGLGGGQAPEGGAGGLPGQPNVPALSAQGRGPAVPVPAQPGSGGQPGPVIPLTGFGGSNTGNE